MPYLPFELDAKKHAAQVAKGLGLESPGRVLEGLLDMWEQVWLRKTDVLDVLVLECCFSFAPGPRCFDLLVAYNFLERASDGRFRVRGAERLLGAAWARSRGGHAAKANLIPGGKKGKNRRLSRAGAEPLIVPPEKSSADLRLQPTNIVGSGSALKPRSPEALDLPSTRDGQEDTSASQARPPVPTGETEQAVKSSVGGLVATVDALYAAANDGQAFPWDPFPNGPQEAALRALEAQHGEKLPELLRTAFDASWPAYGELTGIAKGGSKVLGELRAKATRMKRAATKAATAPPSKGRATNADKDWSVTPPSRVNADGTEEWDVG